MAQLRRRHDPLAVVALCGQSLRRHDPQDCLASLHPGQVIEIDPPELIRVDLDEQERAGLEELLLRQRRKRRSEPREEPLVEAEPREEPLVEAQGPAILADIARRHLQEHPQWQAKVREAENLATSPTRSFDITVALCMTTLGRTPQIQRILAWTLLNVWPHTGVTLHVADYNEDNALQEWVASEFRDVQLEGKLALTSMTTTPIGRRRGPPWSGIGWDLAVAPRCKYVVGVCSYRSKQISLVPPIVAPRFITGWTRSARSGGTRASARTACILPLTWTSSSTWTATGHPPHSTLNWIGMTAQAW